MLVAAYVVLVAVGVMLGVLETFLVPQRVFGGVEGLSAVLALVVNGAVGGLAGIGMRSVSAAIVPTIAWLVTVGVLITYAPGGDVVLAGKLGNDPGVVKAGDAYLLAGVLAGGVSLIVAARFALRSASRSAA